VAAAAISCVCLKIHSGKLISMDISRGLVKSPAWNMNCLIQETAVITTYSPKSTAAEVLYSTNQRHVQFATWQVGQLSSWFQQEHSVQTAGPQSMQDIWSQKRMLTKIEATTSVGTKHLKSQLADLIRTKQLSTLLKSSVEHCHV